MLQCCSWTRGHNNDKNWNPRSCLHPGPRRSFCHRRRRQDWVGDSPSTIIERQDDLSFCGDDDDDRTPKPTCRRWGVQRIMRINRRRRRRYNEAQVVIGGHTTEDDEKEEIVLSGPQPSSFQEDTSSSYPSVQMVARPAKMWPPWPFNLLDSSSRDGDTSNDDEYDIPEPSRVSLLWSLARVSARVGLNNARTVSSQLWFHLPPAAPPFLLLAAIPQRQRMEVTAVAAASTVSDATQNIVYKHVIPLFSSPFARNVALSGLGLAIFSWSHHELNHQRRLSPLPLNPSYRDLNRVVLPTFLPEELSDPVMDVVLEPDNEGVQRHLEATTGDGAEDAILLPPRIHKHWNSLIGKAPKPIDLKTTIREWRRVRAQRRLERQNARRLAIYNELLALQSLKKKTKDKQQKNPGHVRLVEVSNANLGYALVTGASRGIGRAIAVELARYEIPLILVARDIDRLTQLAYDIEACYGVKCCVLQADLSQSDVAEGGYLQYNAQGWVDRRRVGQQCRL